MLAKGVQLSDKLELNDDCSMVKRIEDIPQEIVYQSKMTRLCVAYNLPEDVTEEALRTTFSTCGELSSVNLIKNGKNARTGKVNEAKPPVTCAGTFGLVEFVSEECAQHALLTLSDQDNWRRGMQVVLFDGTTAEKLKRKMFPTVDRRRAKSAAAIPIRRSHVEAVGEGLGDLREGKVEYGVIYSIRGAGGLINPTKYPDACISFRLIPADNEQGLKQGDHVTFTVGRNKKSGRKYASKVVLELRPPNATAGNTDLESRASQQEKDYFSGSSTRWMSRRRAATIGGSPPDVRSRAVSVGSPPQPPRRRLSIGKSPNMSPSTSVASYKQALGPDGTRGFSKGRGQENMGGFRRRVSFSDEIHSSPPPPPNTPVFATAD